jgi:hypothetical protein
MTDTQLAAAVERELATLTPRARVFALAVGAGNSATAAATEARLSLQPAALMRQKRRAAAVLRLLREQARRASMLTLEVAVQRFRELSDEARQEKDYGAATRALREACLLLEIYPADRLRVEHAVSMPEVTPAEWAALAVLRHQVRQALPPAVVVEVLAPAGEVPSREGVTVEALGGGISHLAPSPGGPNTTQAPDSVAQATSNTRNGTHAD